MNFPLERAPGQKCFVSLAAAMLLAPVAPLHAAGMTGLGSLGGKHSYANAISADGSVVVWHGDSGSGNQAFRWTKSGGMTGLGFLPDGKMSEAHGVSADGSVVAGYSRHIRTAPDEVNEAFHWNQ